MPDDKTLTAFYRDYSSAIAGGEAALYLGAGFSRAAGYVDWKELLKEIADELGLDLSKENDLISIAQYHQNKKKNRNKINQAIIDHFNENIELTENHKIAAELPIDTIWTTNYDRLIERSLEFINKPFYIIKKDEDISNYGKGSQVTVYKMNGDVSIPSEAVITRDDFDRYRDNRPLTYSTFRGHLARKTFLFIGVSFDDPNIEQVLSFIKFNLGQNNKNHFAIFKQPNRDDYDSDDDFAYSERKFEIRMDDLSYYGINPIIINNFDEITNILNRIRLVSYKEHILISGSLIVSSENSKFCEDIAYALGRDIIKNGFKLASGLGLGVGMYALTGALEAIYSTKKKSIETHTKLYPFPIFTAKSNQPELIKLHRLNMIKNSGSLIIIKGEKLVEGQIVPADGVEQEYRMALDDGKFVIALGATGGLAERIWIEQKDRILAMTPDSEEDYNILNDRSKSPGEISSAAVKLIKRLLK